MSVFDVKCTGLVDDDDDVESFNHITGRRDGQRLFTTLSVTCMRSNNLTQSVLGQSRSRLYEKLKYVLQLKLIDRAASNQDFVFIVTNLR